MQLFDGISRIISKKDPWRGTYDNGVDGLRTITNLKYTINEKSDIPNDNIFVVHNNRIKYVNIHEFLTHIPFGKEEYYNYDLREPKRKIIHPDKIRETSKTMPSNKDWTSIPYYPTARDKIENVINRLTSAGKPIPKKLLDQIEDHDKKEHEIDVFKPVVNNQMPSFKPNVFRKTGPMGIIYK